jgi:hypothetical protein
MEIRPAKSCERRKFNVELLTFAGNGTIQARLCFRLDPRRRENSDDRGGERGPSPQALAADPIVSAYRYVT